MEDQSWFNVRKLAPGVWVVAEGISTVEEINSYLVEDSEWAALIDTGLGIGDVRAEAEKLTTKPIVVINTHAHWDHVGGDHLFDAVAIHSAEADDLAHVACPAWVRERLAQPGTFSRSLPPSFDPSAYEVRPVQATQLLEHGSFIDLGGRQLQVLQTPGHSPGSICLLDEEHRFLFTGDTIYSGPLYAHLDHSDLGAYRASAQMLAILAYELDLLFPAHGPTPLDGLILREIANGFDRVLGGQVACQTVDTPQGPACQATFDRFSILFKEEQIHDRRR
jgi:glyoxylase-like metal-dependent hydrolase (beta-lactamase superfamily II)